MLTTSTSTSPAAGTLTDLASRAHEAADRDREVLVAITARQMKDLVLEVNRTVEDHVRIFGEHINGVLDSTKAGIAADLETLDLAAKATSRLWIRRLIWPTACAALLSLLMLLTATILSWQKLQDLPPATTTSRDGQTYQILAGPGWTTCHWQGADQPCRTLTGQPAPTSNQ